MSAKTLFQQHTRPSKIQSIQFGLLSSQDIVKLGEFHVHERNLYRMPLRQPLENGVLDPRLGTTDKKGTCETCHGKLLDCAGHYAYIKLELPVFHIGYFKHVVSILQCICKTCASVLITEEERRYFLVRFRSPRLEVLQRRVLYKKMWERCKRCKICPRCGDINGIVKKASGGTLKIIHDKFNKQQGALLEFSEQFEEACSHNREVRQNLSRVQDDLNPVRVLGLLERISDEDCELLDLAERPERLIVTHIPVPPVCIRPSVEMESAAGSNEDDITMKLTTIIEVNNILRQGLDKGLLINNLMDNWDFLQTQCAMYINSDLPGMPLTYQGPGKPLRGFVQRLKGKQGRFRGNLSGKRVDFSGRTVISPDPNLRVDEVGVPVHVATTLTYPERVSRYNIAKLRKRVLNGMSKHPGANFLILQDGSKLYLKFGNRRRCAEELKEGDIVERHLEDGDIVLFNRQPSLHKMSIMSHRVRVMPWRTFRFNECACTPYNADFDGDEMNLHVPQTEEARAEAMQLMGVPYNLCTPKNGEILVSAIQDFITSAYLVANKDMFFDRAEFSLLCCYMIDAAIEIDLPAPAILKPVELWTGKQIFSVLVRPNQAHAVFVNLEVEEKAYSRSGQHMCPNDGYVCFLNSELLCGRLGKATLGNGSKNGLFSVLQQDYGAYHAATCMNRLSKLSARFIGDQGFSIGIDDVTPSVRLGREKEVQVAKGYNACEKHVAAYRSGTLCLQAGCNAEQTLEANMTGELNKIREDAGKMCQKELDKSNSALIMAQCGSKGSPLNISQMIACVGQQTVSGQRIPNGFISRTLPHFPRHCRNPDAKGFVANSFFTGMTPTEFFFHTMGGREGLVDTAVKTAETGYMSRRLMKALEDLSTQYDATVRNSTGGIVQLVYGDDGLDPVTMEGKKNQPIDFTRTMFNVQAAYPHGEAPPLLKEEMKMRLMEHLSDHSMITPPNPEGETAGLESFCRQVTTYLEHRAVQAEEHLKKSNLSLSANESELSLKLVHRLIGGVSAEQLEAFIEICAEKYAAKKIEAGSAVGAVGAQSIGEPGTQMTLKTFHFAGVASMNVTLGVPRIKEIINASKTISTPIITVQLVCDNDVKAARIVKGRIERTTLGEISSSMEIVLQPRQSYIAITLDLKAIESLQLDVTASTVRQCILDAPKLKLKERHIDVVSEEKLYVLPTETEREKLFFSLQGLRANLPKVIVKGIPTVERAVINDQGSGRYNLLVEGTNLLSVMGTEGVCGTHTTSNHVVEIEKTLGIEAARTTIISEIQYTMGNHGMSIDTRHSMLLADVMTYKGEVLGITRFGIAKMKDSVLMLASFEKTTDHLFDAAIHGRVDEVVGVSECIIMGVPMPVGTGVFKLVHQHPQTTSLAEKRGPALLLS